MPQSPVSTVSPLSASDAELLLTGRKRIAELEAGMEEMRGGFAELHAKLAESEKRNKELQIILASDAGDVPELRRRLEGRDERIEELEHEVKDYESEVKGMEERIGELEDELEECQEERDDFEGQHESAEQALEVAEKKLKGYEERIAELEEALKQEQEEVEDTRATLKAEVERSHKEIKRIGDSSRAIQAELDEKDCELAEVREHMKELLHGYLAENARANKAGTELLKKLEAQEEEEAREAGEAMMKAMAGTPMVPAEPEVTHIGSINTASASFQRYIASLPEDERREILGMA